jgi:hypothetical protein
MNAGCSTVAVKSPDLSTGLSYITAFSAWMSGIEGGAEGDRTPDLRAASAALSQLSYGPLKAVRVYAARPGVST